MTNDQLFGHWSLVISSGSLFRFGKLGQALAAEWLPQLEQAAGLDLANALTGDAIRPGHFLQRPGLAVLEPEAQLDHLALPRCQRPQHLGNPFPEQMLIDGLAGVDG